MTINDFIDLERNFSSIQKEVNFDESDTEHLPFDFSKPINWTDIEQKYRVVILAEAGAGKTVEIQEATRRLRNRRKRAFFIRLEYLPDGIDEAFEGGDLGEYSEFVSWQNSDDPAWIFLDSVDESKLSNPRDFEKAIRKFSQALGTSSQRAHIFITSRVPGWDSKSDLNLVESKLPFIAMIDNNADQIAPLDITSEIADTAVSLTQEKNQGFEIYALAALNKFQISKFSLARHIINCDNFLDEIERRDAGGFASRPQDLENLVEFWKSNGYIGSRLELIRASINQKVHEEDKSRGELRPLTKEKTLRGIRTIAAATTLQKNALILTSPTHGDRSGINPNDCLPDWTAIEISTLLSRPIFDPALYGTVRFHHRSVREFLTAEWFNEMLQEGKPRKPIERLFFKEKYALQVLVPTMSPILPWMALLDERIRNKTLSLVPNILFKGGDPSMLPLDVRNKILRSVCGQMNSGTSSDLSFDYAEIRHFAQLDTSSTVFELLQTHHDHKEIRTLLLGLVWHARMSNCSDICLEIAINCQSDTYSRIAALRAVSVFESPQSSNNVINFVVANSKNLSDRVLAETIECFSPKQLDVVQIAKILEGIKKPRRHSYSSLDGALSELILRCDPDQLYLFIQVLTPLLATKPFVERRHCEISERYIWLQGIAAKACEKLIEMRHELSFSPECLTIIAQNIFANDYTRYTQRDHNFFSLVPEWTQLNHSLFWHNIAQARGQLDKKKNERLKDWWHARTFPVYWKFSKQDFELMLKAIETKELLDDKLVALTLSFQLYKENRHPRKWHAKLKKTTNNNVELKQTLAKLVNPPPMSDSEKKWRNQEANYKRQQLKREEKEIECLNNWKSWLSANTKILIDVSVAERGTIWNSQLYLRERMRSLASENNMWAYGNWQDLTPVYGEGVARAFRDGAVAYWRKYTPKLSSEGIENPNSVPHAVVFGLCGLTIEFNETEKWAENLGEEDAILATKYALWEMNGFPTWLPSLYEVYPDLVGDIMLVEIQWEINEYHGENECHYIISDLAWQGEWIKLEFAHKILNLLKVSKFSFNGTLTNCLRTILRVTDITGKEISGAAMCQLNDETPIEQQAIWLAILISVEPEQGLKTLDKKIGEFKTNEAVTNFCIQVASNLGSDRRATLNLRDTFKSPNILKRLFSTLHKHIKVEDDIERAGTGTYSPTARDEAQDARNTIFTFLKEIPGKEAYLALKELGENHPHVKARSWMKGYAVNRAELDADIEKWSSEDIHRFSESSKQFPNTHSQLFELASARLHDLKDDLENGDSSISSIIIQAKKETDHRKFIGGWLRDQSNGLYATPQEEELADAKRPDIRMHGMGFDAPVPIELKVADNWSGNVLFERLENQLCNDYLRDRRSNSGIYLLVYRGTKKTWETPVGKKRLNFEKLLQALQCHVNKFIQNNAAIEQIEVIGINLTKRSTPLY